MKIKTQTWQTVTGATALRLSKGLSTMQFTFGSRAEAAAFLRAARRAK